MHSVHRTGDAQGDEEGDMYGGRSQEVPVPSSASEAPPELQFPASSAQLKDGSSMKPGTQSWLSRGGLDKANKVENWRQEVSDLSDVV